MPSRRINRLATVLTGLLVCGCGELTMSGPPAAMLSVVPVLPEGTPAAALAPVDDIRLRLLRPLAEVVLDSVIPFPADSSRVTIQLRIPLKELSEVFALVVELRAAGATLFRAAQTIIVYADGAGPSARPAPVLVYVGPGSTAQLLRISPLDTVLTLGALFLFRATAFDQAGGTVADAPVLWSTNSLLTSISGDGLLLAPVTRGAVLVRARTPTGAADSTRVRFAPLPTLLTAAGGDNQTLSAGSILANPLTARVLAADGLGVPGVVVQFRPLDIGASVQSTSVTTDDNGNAATIATLGTVAGLYQFEAAVAGLGTATFGATAVAGPAALIGIVSGDGQSVLSLAALLNPLVVRVTDQYGNPVQGAIVDWLITSGGGLLGAASTVTGPLGTTSNSYTASLLAGTALVRASIRGAPATAQVTFTINIL